MRILFVMALSLFFISSITLGQDTEIKDPEPKTFKEAYAGYRKYENAESYDDKHLRTHFSQEAFELGYEKFGPEHLTTSKLLLNWMYSYTDHYRDHYSPYDFFVFKYSFSYLIKPYEKENSNNKLVLVEPYTKYAEVVLKRRNPFFSPKRAKIYIAKAINILSEKYGKNSLEEANYRLRVGEIYVNNFNLPISHKHFRVAREIFAKHGEKYKIDYAIATFWLAKSEKSADRPKKAKANMLEALNTFETDLPSHPFVLVAHAFMVQLLEEQGKSDEATKHCQAIGLKSQTNPNQDYIPLYKKRQKYPKKLARRKKTGVVFFEFTVDENGFVQNPKVIKNIGDKGFIQPSLEALTKYRYAPRYVNGKPVKTEGVKQALSYRLSN